MNVLIAEDESLAAERLTTLLRLCRPSSVIVDVLDTVRDIVSFFHAKKDVDLMLLDIELADGKCFEAFNKVPIEVPVIFVTAYDQFALQAFKFHSIDYLLKPIQHDDLFTALTKFEKMTVPRIAQTHELELLKNTLFPSQKVYKERLMIKSGNKLQYRNTGDVSYFFAEGKEVYMVCRIDNRRYLIDHTLEELERMLNPKVFFRISRKFVVHIDCIAEVKGLISSKLELRITPPAQHELLISRERAQDFKCWLDN